jgi:hypothetical protein
MEARPRLEIRVCGNGSDLDPVFSVFVAFSMVSGVAQTEGVVKLTTDKPGVTIVTAGISGRTPCQCLCFGANSRGPHRAASPQLYARKVLVRRPARKNRP